MLFRSVPHLNHHFAGEIVWSCHVNHGLRHGLTHHAMFPLVKSIIFSGHLRPTCFFSRRPTCVVWWPARKQVAADQMVNWLVVWNMFLMNFHSVGNFIIPTDFHSIIFQRGRAQPPTRLIIIADYYYTIN